MASTPSTDDRRYEALVGRIVQNCQEAEANNLKRYHKIGELFVEFLQRSDQGYYGAASADKLAEDLQEKGVLQEISNVRRWLYHAKALFETYTLEKLEELSERGFTASHAKKLFPCSEEVRRQVEAQLIRDGRVIPTRELDDLVRNVNQDRIAQAAADAAEESRTDREEAEPENVDDQLEEPDTVEEQAAEEPIPAEAGDDERPDGVPATGRPTITEPSVKNPLKVLKEMNKNITRVNTLIPQVFIVIREASQIGFESDAACERHLKQLRELQAGIRAMVPPITEVETSVSEELQASELPAEEP